MLKRALLFALALGLRPSVLWGVIPTPIYAVLTDKSDKGISGDDIFIWGPAGGNSVILDSTTTNPPPPEGLRSMKAVAVSGAGSTWAVVYLNPDRTNRSVDLSAYASGEMRFWAYCDTDNFDVLIQHLNGTQDGYSYQGQFHGAFNQWVPVIFPLGPITSQFPINDIFSPFLITAHQAGTCYIDNVRYVNPPAPGADVFNVNVKDIATQAPAAGLTWSNGILPTGWALSNQYIELAVDNLQDLHWGVQIYTKNTATGANPKYVISVSSNPAGLVDIADPTVTLPVAWSITAGTQAPAAVAPTAAEPNDNPSNPHAFPWLYMKDAATPDIPSQNTTAFQNGELYVTVKNNVGIHFGQNDVDNHPSFGAENPPNYIFLEANFGRAFAQHRYQTNRLILEFFIL